MIASRSWALTFFFVAAFSSFASDTTATRGKLVFSLGAGPSYNPGPTGTPRHLDTRLQTLGVSLSGRLMWHPGHRLRVGLESGWTDLYSYSIEGPGPPGSVRVTAIPLLLMWSMRLTDRLEAHAGWGTYRLTSTLDYLGTVRTSMYSQGYAAAVSYRLPLGKSFDGALELKWMNAFVTGHNLLALQWRVDWRFLQW